MSLYRSSPSYSYTVCVQWSLDIEQDYVIHFQIEPYVKL
jgi:hypothetical protein